jgi:hypothetical protein
MTTICTKLSSQSDAVILPFSPVGANTATNVQDAIELAALLGGGGSGSGGAWGIVSTSANMTMAAGNIYVVSGVVGAILLSLPGAAAIGDAVGVYMEDYSSSAIATIDAGVGATVGQPALGMQRHTLAGMGAFCVYRYIGGAVWMTEQPIVTKQIRYRASAVVLNKIYDDAVLYVDSATALTVTVPSDASDPLPVGYQVEIIRFGAGALTVVADSGVTINAASALSLSAQGVRGTLTKIDADLWSWSTGVTANQEQGSIAFDILGDVTADGGLSAVSTGVKATVEVPYACVITRAAVLADVSGSIVLDVWRAPYASTPPVIGGSIVASAPPTLTSAVRSQDSALIGWTTALAAGDWLSVNVVSAASVRRVTLSLTVRKT